MSIDFFNENPFDHLLSMQSEKTRTRLSQTYLNGVKIEASSTAFPEDKQFISKAWPEDRKECRDRVRTT